MTNDECRTAADRDRGAARCSFLIPRSSFVICHLSFFIYRSSFVIPRNQGSFASPLAARYHEPHRRLSMVRRTMTRFLPWAAVALLTAAPASDPIAIKDVDYAGLGRSVRDLQGKVVVVDLWATT
jgi:hypothetical protein